MRLFFVLLLLSFSTCAILSSCGKDHDSPSTPPAPDPVDSIPSNWLKAQTPADSTGVTDIFFANNTTGYAIGEKGEVWKSADGGLSWSSVYKLPGNRTGYNLAATANGKVYIVMYGVADGIYTSADGATFQYQHVGNIDIAADVYFTGNDTGYISGANTLATNPETNGVWQTTDGGSNWQLIPVAGTGTDSRSSDLSFYNTAYAYLMNNGSVYHTSGYNQWSTRVAVSAALCSIAAPAKDIAFAADSRGAIYKTTDGGASFTAIATLSLPTGDSYVNLHFLSVQVGYATAANVLYKTTDGGLTWLPVLTSKNKLSEVHFTDANHGWVCADNGTILVYRP